MTKRAIFTIVLALGLLGVCVIVGDLIARHPSTGAPDPEAGLSDAEAIRRMANQFSAVFTLRNVISAQAQLQAAAKIDVDQDGIGEYGGFKEMSGDLPGRMCSPLRPKVLTDVFGRLNAHGEAGRGGYLFRVYLPDVRRAGVGEPTYGYSKISPVDPDLAERLWCVYAWPAQALAPPRPTYFVNQAGDVLSTRDARYVGPGHGPAPHAAYAGAGGIDGIPAEGARGQDGNVWKLVN